MLSSRIILVLIGLAISLCSAAQWGFGLSADPFLQYAGNLTSGNNEAPSWVGSDDQPLAADLFKWSASDSVMMRYRIELKAIRAVDETSVPPLDDDLQPIDGKDMKEKRVWKDLNLYIGMAKEKRVGDGRLQGLIGRSISLGVSRQQWSTSTVNPLAAYVNDTISFDSGFALHARAMVYTGCVYTLDHALAISARIGWGARLNYLPESRMGTVQEISNSAELIEEVQRPESNSFSLDTMVFPELTLIFYPFNF